jgi:hypothetical protein
VKGERCRDVFGAACPDEWADVPVSELTAAQLARIARAVEAAEIELDPVRDVDKLAAEDQRAWLEDVEDAE